MRGITHTEETGFDGKDCRHSIELANAYAPSHSRIFRELVLIAKPDKPFIYTGKGSIRKSFAIREHAEEIDALYAAQAARASVDVKAPTVWSLSATEAYVREVVGKVLVQEVDDGDDIFQSGGDRYVHPAEVLAQTNALS